MTTNQSELFQNVATPNQNGTHVESNSNQVFETLVGEGKKFKTPEDLAVGKLHSDEFIVQLKTELETLKKQVGEANQMDALLKELREAKEALNKRDIQQPVEVQQPDIPSLVRQQIELDKAQTVQQANMKQVEDTLLSKMGTKEKAIEFIVAKANELGISPTVLQNTAATSPTAFYRMVALEAVQAPVQQDLNIRTSTINTNSLPNTSDETQLRDYWRKMLKENRSAYFSPANCVLREAQVREGKLKFN